MKTLNKFSIGIGDRFGQQGEAQLKAIMAANEKGLDITPVWNKSNREHSIIGTHPGDVRIEADSAAKKAGFRNAYFVDADHINLETVDKFIESSDFFTIDVASFIGKRANDLEIEEFLDSVGKYTGNFRIPGLKETFKTSKTSITHIAERYLFAAIKAFEVYRRIEKKKGKGNFITEISMDEVHHHQTPVELFFILNMLSSENIPVQTIAPKFPGKFNKGVDYIGDPEIFADEFESDLMVLDFAIGELGLPDNLKMSIHSGSDKFALYPHIGSIIRKHNKGIHVKTAGTTWLEEVTGLAESGGEALDFVKEIYFKALDSIEELCAPYAGVTDIKISALPSKNEVTKWNGSRFARSLRHIQEEKEYNPNLRQLMHVSFKLAALEIKHLNALLEANKTRISEGVFENIYRRHICNLFETGK